MKRLSDRRPRAFLLTEILVVILLLGVVMLILSQLFVVAFQAKSQAEQRDALLHRIDFAILALRRDVWSAAEIHADGPRLALTTGAGESVIWTYTPDGRLTRASTIVAPRTWPALPPVQFTAVGPLVTLHLFAADGDETLALPSQQMLAPSGTEAAP